MIIDAHHHLWRYTAAEFDWIDDAMAVLRRDFSVDDLRTEMAAAGVDGTVAVQARQSIDETQWLCGLVGVDSPIRGVVGWAPIASANFGDVLEELHTLPGLVGLRHVVQSEAPGFLDVRAFNDGVTLLGEAGLTYDVLIFERQLEEAIRFVDRHPRQRFVVDHVAKPKIAAGELEPWASRMRELARREHVWCKVSGMVTEAEWSAWTPQTLRPYLDVCMEVFGPERVMAGSDWPVCLVASTYGYWWQTLRDYFAGCSEAERTGIFGGNAIQFYRL